MSIHKTNFLQFVIFTILHLGGEGRVGPVGRVGALWVGEELVWGKKEAAVMWFKGLSPFSL